jgi:hypothetical protein
VPVGFPFLYRLILFSAYLFAAGWTMYKGYQYIGPNWLLMGWPLAMVVGVFAQRAILRAFPPKLEPHAEGSTWLKLT